MKTTYRFKEISCTPLFFDQSEKSQASLMPQAAGIAAMTISCGRCGKWQQNDTKMAPIVLRQWLNQSLSGQRALEFICHATSVSNKYIKMQAFWIRLEPITAKFLCATFNQSFPTYSSLGFAKQKRRYAHLWGPLLFRPTCSSVWVWYNNGHQPAVLTHQHLHFALGSQI